MSRLIGTTLVDRIELMENDLIDDKYIVYKCKMYLKNREVYIRVRVVTKTI